MLGEQIDKPKLVQLILEFAGPTRRLRRSLVSDSGRSPTGGSCHHCSRAQQGRSVAAVEQVVRAIALRALRRTRRWAPRSSRSRNPSNSRASRAHPRGASFLVVLGRGARNSRASTPSSSSMSKSGLGSRGAAGDLRRREHVTLCQPSAPCIALPHLARSSNADAPRTNGMTEDARPEVDSLHRQPEDRAK